MKLVYKILAGIVGVVFSILLAMVGRKAIRGKKQSKRVSKALEPKKALKTVVKVKKEEKKEEKKDEDKELSESEEDSDEELLAKAEIARRGLNREVKVMKHNMKKNRNKRG